MKRKKGTELSDEPVNQEETQSNSRRDFFKKSALGVGSLAMMSGASLVSCEPQNSGSAGMGTVQGGNSPQGLWGAPAEINLTEPVGDLTTIASEDGIEEVLNDLPYFQSIKVDPKVPFSHIPYSLVVDDNVSGKTPSGTKILYGYNGTVPGPTFVVRGDQNLEVLLWNHLPGNDGQWAYNSGSRLVKTNERVPEGTLDWQIDGHVYGPHQQNVTNLHTHGLHISPGVFSKTQSETAKQVQSDNVLLRCIPLEDYYNREKRPGADGPKLLNNEVVGFVRYKFHLPRPNGNPHYPGTHWYHPHPHGATFDQVAGGMAGFLIVEGPIDDYIAGLFQNNNYQELPLLIQRVLGPTPAPAAEQSPQLQVTSKGSAKKLSKIIALANGHVLGLGCTIPTNNVNPNQVLRLRVLNGSVDGKGYLRFFIKKGNAAPDLINPNESLYKNNAHVGGKDVKNASSSAKLWYSDEAASDSLPMLNMAYDGVNLMDADGDYSALAVEWLTIGVANRADFLVAIPADAKAGDVYTIWGQQMIEAVDSEGSLSPDSNSNLNLQIAQFIVQEPSTALPAPPLNTDGTVKIDWKSQGQVDEILLPVSDDEITIKDNSETTEGYIPPSPTNLDGQPISMSKNNNAGKAVRARRVVYSGWGDAGVDGAAYSPTISTNPTVKKLYNSMLIDGKKYGADTKMHSGWDVAQHKMLVDTAEEWTIYNYSMTTYIKDTTKPNTDESNFVYGVPAYKNGNGSTIPGLTSNAQRTTSAVHHPFHIHQNAFWVKSIQDEEGNELLPLDGSGNPIPRWQDVVYIPHNGGRVVFRSRFMDYTGKYVNHCHLLQHEDWGMMQAVEVVDGKTDKPNYTPLPKEDAQNVFPGLNLRQMVALDVGKVKEALVGEDTANPVKMLCYDPATTTFFEQNKLTNFEAKQVQSNYFATKYGPNGGTGNADLIKWDNENLGYMIIAVPEDGPQFPKWK